MRETSGALNRRERREERERRGRCSRVNTATAAAAAAEEDGAQKYEASIRRRDETPELCNTKAAGLIASPPPPPPKKITAPPPQFTQAHTHGANHHTCTARYVAEAARKRCGQKQAVTVSSARDSFL